MDVHYKNSYKAEGKEAGLTFRVQCGLSALRCRVSVGARYP